MTKQSARVSKKLLGRIGFRGRFMLLVGLSFALFAAITGAAIPMLAGKVLIAREEQEGREIAISFARQSTLAALYRSPENGREAAERTRSFPGITYVAIADQQGSPILTLGEHDDAWKPPLDVLGALRGEEVYVHQNAQSLHFIVPVTVRASADQSVLSPPKDETLGYVHVVRSKESANQLSAQLAYSVTLVTLLSLAVALAFSLPMANRMLRPVRELSGRLANALSDPTAVRVTESGPPELVNMARAFNRLMELLEDRDRQLREHSRQLELQVKERTLELERARDIAIAADRHKSEFLATVSHELRTPLQSIMGYTEMVARSVQVQADPLMAEDLSVVLQAAGQLEMLISNILDLSKIDAGRMEVSWSEVDIQSLAREIADTIAPLARRNRNQLRFEYDGQVDRIFSDRRKLLQISLNLLSNACKFTQDGHITFSVSCDAKELVITVRDTGRGIAESEQTIIFEPFRQANPGGDHPGGTGLGLAVSSRLCELLGGTIGVESEPGKGSAFTVLLPVETAASEQLATVNSNRRTEC